jgi:hypothetical protein
VGALELSQNAIGSVYVFQKQGTAWNQVQRVQPSGADRQDRFGEELSLDGNALLVGAPFRKDGRGNAHLFRFSGRLGNCRRSGLEHSSLAGAGSAFSFAARYPGLDANPQQLQLMDPVQWTACGGAPGQPLLLMIGQVPLLASTPIAGVFDSSGHWSLSTAFVAGPSLTDLPITLLTLDSQRQVTFSNATSISLR